MADCDVTLTDHLAEFVDQQVSTGRHANADEVVREALRRYEQELVAEQACVDMILSIANEGREAIRRGEFALIDGEAASQALFDRVTGRAPTPENDPLAALIAEVRADARAGGLTDADIDAELAACNAERRI